MPISHPATRVWFSVCETFLFREWLKCVTLERGYIVDFQDFQYPVSGKDTL